MQKNENIKKQHSVFIDDRKSLKATGVLDVESFDDTKIFAMLENLAITVGGKSLKVTGFSKESGELFVEGEVDSVTYSNALSKKAGILARIFR